MFKTLSPSLLTAAIAFYSIFQISTTAAAATRASAPLGSSKTLNFTLGVNFGKDYITASRFVLEDDTMPELVARIFGNREYRTFMAKMFTSEPKPYQMPHIYEDQGEPNDSHLNDYNEKQVQGIFSEALMSVKASSQKKLGSAVTVGAVSYPEWFDLPTIFCMRDGAVVAEPFLKRNWQFKKYFNAARLAYGLNSCGSFGLGSSDCAIEAGPHLIVHIHFDGDTLHYILAEINEFASQTVSQVEVKGLDGDKFWPFAADEQGHGGLSQNDIGRMRSQFQHFLKSSFETSSPNAFSNFMQRIIFYYPSWQQNPHTQLDRFEDLHAVVFSGEASFAAMEKIRKIIVEELPDIAKTKSRNSIDPRYVATAGAAFQARLFGLDPSWLEDPNEGSHQIEVLGSHDEL
ncbi:hypothetical protein B0J14DRAFT_571797 [Halenospora varia]|nr:hypothetical protein B0J14DRAFT_571797 [Halenospora varia]